MLLYEGEIRTIVQRQQSQHLLMPGSSTSHAPLKIPGDDALYIILKTAIISDMHLQLFLPSMQAASSLMRLVKGRKREEQDLYVMNFRNLVSISL